MGLYGGGGKLMFTHARGPENEGRAGRGRGEAGEDQASANRGAAQGGKDVWLSCAVAEQHEGKIKNKVKWEGTNAPNRTR